MEYEYDIREVMDRYLDGKGHLSNWTDALNFQEAAYPVNYIKARCLENHDQPRIASRVRSEAALRNYTALQFFLKGAALVYAGQEYGIDHQPTLFDPDPVDWTVRTDLSGLMIRLNRIRKTVFSPYDSFEAGADDAQDAAWMKRRDGNRLLLGVFSLKGEPATVAAGVPDGRYENLLGGPEVSVEQGLISTGGEPVILRVQGE
jgi:glycosidase